MIISKITTNKSSRHSSNRSENGNLTSASNEVGKVAFGYDAFDQVTAVSNAGPNGAVAYQYDSARNVTGAVSAAGTTAYAYDEAERLVRQRAASGGFDYAYNPTNGLVDTVSNTATRLTMKTEYDILDRLTALRWLTNGAAAVRGFGYQYSLAGMITNVTLESGEKTSYTYDSLDRLTGERRVDAGGTVSYAASYAYDLAGNRTQSVVNGVTNTGVLGTGNKLTSWAAGTTIGYDLAGNVTNLTGGGRALALRWNSRYQVASVVVSGQVAEACGYDALGRRVTISDGAETNWLVYDGPHVVAEVTSNGALKRSYTYGPGIDNILSMSVYTNSGGTTSVSSIYYYIKDHLGTVHALVDTNGAVVESYRYDAWGRVLAVYDSDRQSSLPPNNPLDGTVPPGLARQGRVPPQASPHGAFARNQPTQSAIGNRYLWQGREYSWKTGLYYFRARWYDPITGRWLSNDPIGISGGLNQYVFCANNPVNFVDPFGQDLLSGSANFFAGAADVLSFGGTRAIRNSFPEYYSQDYNSGAYSAGEWSGVGLSAAIGGAGGLKAAGTKAAGKEFSHWIPDRLLKKTGSDLIRDTFGKSPFNGNYVSAARHFLHDPRRWPVGWDTLGARWNPVLRQLDRIPNLVKGAALGGLLGGGSKAANDTSSDDNK